MHLKILLGALCRDSLQKFENNYYKNQFAENKSPQNFGGFLSFLKIFVFFHHCGFVLVCVVHKRAILLGEFSLNMWSHMGAGNPLLQNSLKSAKCAATA